jgi:hypothetical protein
MKCKSCGKEIPEDQVLEFTGTGAVYGTASLESFRTVGIEWSVSDSEDETVKCPHCGEVTPVEYEEAQDSLETIMPAQLTGKEFNKVAVKFRSFEIEEAKKATMLQRQMKGVIYTVTNYEGKLYYMKGFHACNRLYFVVVWRVDKTKLKPRLCCRCSNNGKDNHCAAENIKDFKRGEGDEFAKQCKEFF